MLSCSLPAAPVSVRAFVPAPLLVRRASPAVMPSSRLARSASTRSTSRRSVAASINWPALSRRANATLANLRATVHASAFERALRDRIARDSHNPFLWHALAKHLAVERLNVDAAINVLQTAVRRVPPGSRGGLYEAWGTMEQRRGNLHHALRIYSDAVLTDPYAALSVSLALIQIKLHLVDDARHTLTDASHSFPSYAPIWRAWAYLETQHGQLHDALQKWRLALQKDPTNPRAWSSFIGVERRAGASNTRLVPLLTEAISHCPKDAILRLTLAQIEERRKSPRASRAILFPIHTHNDTSVLRQLGRIDFDTRDYDSGRAFFRRAADLEAALAVDIKNGKRRSKRRTVKSLHAWAHMEAKSGHSDRARALLQEAVSICDSDAGVWRAIAEIESRSHNYEQARNAFRKALALDPRDPRLLLSYGRTEAMAGNLRQAEALVESVAKMATSKHRSLFSTAARRDRCIDDGFEDDYVSNLIHSSQSDQEQSGDMTLTPRTLATTLRESAMLAARDGRLDDSISLLYRATEVNPSAETVWRLLANHLIQRHGIEQARSVYQKALQNVDGAAIPKVLHWWGQDERNAGNMEKARELFVRATETNPRYMSAWISWGLLEKSQDNLQQACDIFEKAAKRAEQDGIKAPYLFQTWGRIEELQRGRPDVGAEIFGRGVRVAPRSGSLWGSWGLLEHRRGNHGKAREMFRAATTAEPSIGSAWHSWALLESSRCNYQYALELFKLGHDNDPANASLLTSWALLESRELGNVARGRELFQRAVESDPQYAPAWHSWGCLEMNEGNIMRAKELLVKASEVRADDPAPWHTLGILEAERLGNDEQAVKHWEKALSIAPGHALTHQSWGVFLARRGRMEEARRMFESGISKAQWRGPDRAMLLQAWAAEEQKSEQTEKARDLLAKSIEADERRAESWVLMATLAEKRGLKAEARDLYRRGVEAAAGSAAVDSLYISWGGLEVRDGEVQQARGVFESGIRACPSSGALWRAYASFEERSGNVYRANEIERKVERLFGPKQRADSS